MATVLDSVGNVSDPDRQIRAEERLGGSRRAVVGSREHVAGLKAMPDAKVVAAIVPDIYRGLDELGLLVIRRTAQMLHRRRSGGDVGGRGEPGPARGTGEVRQINQAIDIVLLDVRNNRQ
jgi:hypothetical protein